MSDALTPDEREYVEYLRGWSKAQGLESSNSAIKELRIIDRLCAEAGRVVPEGRTQVKTDSDRLVELEAKFKRLLKILYDCEVVSEHDGYVNELGGWVCYDGCRICWIREEAGK